MKLTTTQDAELNRIHALLYGNSGIGKTTSIKTLPEATTLVVTGERDCLPLRKRSFPVARFDTWDDLKTICNAIYSQQSENAALTKLVQRAKILVIDSLAQVSILCIQQILNVDRPVIVAERTKKERDTPKGVYAEVLTQEDWGLFGTRILNFINAVCQLPIHTICLCPSVKPTSGQEKQCLYAPERVPAISGRAAESCMQHFGLILHMQPGKTEGGEDTRVWRTYNDGASEAKDSAGILNPYEPADWSYVFKKLLSPEDYTEVYGETK